MKTTAQFALAISVLLLVTSCGSTIPAGSKGVYRGFFSGTRDAVYDDGFKWHWLWNNVTSYDVRWNTYVERLEILSSDDLHMEAEIALQMRPSLDWFY